MEAKPDFGIHAVVVSHDPGLWFDEMLESIAGQDHPLVDVTVVDAGSEADPTARVRRILPEAAVCRLGANPGFGPAANQVLLDAGGSESATLESGSAAGVPDFYVFCHDDVVLAADALRLLAEEAVRSNAGIVGPKYVDWDEPNRIREVGLIVDKTGVPASSVELGEYDQQQHDAVQEVFAAPGGCMLVRGDLFHAIGGFDPEMSFCYENVDLCWRARTMGARVMVAPAAVVRHRGRLAERLSPARIDLLKRRHRVRTLLSVYGLWHSVRVIPQAVVLSGIEALAALLTGHLREFRDIAASWARGLFGFRSIRRRRQAVGRSRRVGDARIRALQSSGLAPVLPFLADRGGGRAALANRLGQSRVPLAVGVVVAAVVLLGARDLLAGGIPAAGGLARLGSSADLLGEWWSDHRPVGLGREGFAPTGFGVLTVLSWLFFGQTGLLRTVLIVGMVPLGAWGAWRLMRPFGSLWIQGVALAVYLANPVPYNALANGSWSGLLLYGAAPWLMRALLDGSGLPPYGVSGAGAGAGERKPYFWRDALKAGTVFALAGSLAPEAVIVMGLLLGGLLLGSALAASGGGLARMTAVAVVGAVVAGVLNLPWLADGLPALLADRPGGNGANSWAEILRFDTGPFGDIRLGWALPAAAILPLAVAQDSRLAWAVRGWTLYLASAAAALAAENDWSPVPLPRPEVVQVPGALGLAIAVAMGVAAFQVDLRRHRFGWRQVVPLSAAAALIAGMLPALAAVSPGDWNATGGDYARAAPFAVEEGANQRGNSQRVLWLGHPDVIPLGSWELDGRLWFTLSDGARFPTVAQRWAGPLDGGTREVGQAVLHAQSAGTNRLGAELARWGIDTILVPERLAPPPYGDLVHPAPEWLFNVLDGQLDLVRGRLTAGIAGYSNTALAPMSPQSASAAEQAGNAMALEAVAFEAGYSTSPLHRFWLAAQVAMWVAALVGLARLSTGGDWRLPGGRRAGRRAAGVRAR